MMQLLCMEAYVLILFNKIWMEWLCECNSLHINKAIPVFHCVLNLGCCMWICPDFVLNHIYRFVVLPVLALFCKKFQITAKSWNVFCSASTCTGKCNSSPFNSAGPPLVGGDRYWWLSHHLLHSTISTEASRCRHRAWSLAFCHAWTYQS